MINDVFFSQTCLDDLLTKVDATEPPVQLHFNRVPEKALLMNPKFMQLFEQVKKSDRGLS